MKDGRTALQVAELQRHAQIATLIRSKKQKGAGSVRKEALPQASPEEIKKKQKDADRAMRELLEEEEKAADAHVPASHKKKQAKTAKVPAPLQADVEQAASNVLAAASNVLAAAATSEAYKAEALFMSKFGNLSVGGGGGETDTGAEAGSASGEGDDVFKSMDAECKVCMQESKVSHQVAYSAVRRLAQFTHTNGEPTCSRTCLRLVDTSVCVATVPLLLWERPRCAQYVALLPPRSAPSP